MGHPCQNATFELERASQQQQNAVNFSFVTPSSVELYMSEERDHHGL